MDLSALERNISNLERSLDSLEVWLAFMTGLVVLGLVLEYWHQIPEAIATLKENWSWKPLFVIAGGLLITVGVVGELAVQFIASGKETKLRKANDAVFAGLNTEAAAARKAAEDEGLERMKLEAQLAPRNLTIEQQQQIANDCRRFAGRSVTISAYVADAEGIRLALEIKSALDAAGSQVTDNIAREMAVGFVEVGVKVQGLNTARDLVNTVAESLRRHGNLLVSVPVPNKLASPNAPTEIIVGVKPLPLLKSRSEPIRPP